MRLNDQLTKRQNEFLKQYVEWTREFMRTRHSDNTPVAILWNQSIEVQQPVPLEFRCDQDKAEMQQKIRIMARWISADAALFISESHVIKERLPEYNQGVAQGKWTRPSECPFAEDMVVFSFETYDATWSGMAPVVQLANGMRSFSVVEFHKTESSEGRFSDLLPKRGKGRSRQATERS